MTEKGGFTKIPNELLDKIYSSKLSAKQIRVILFILRFTRGTLNQRSNIFRLCELKIAGIYPSDSRCLLESLREINVITYEPEEMVIGINPFLDDWSVENHETYDEEAFSKKLRRSLAPHKRGSRSFANRYVGRTPTTTAVQGAYGLYFEAPKESKESINKENKVVFNNSFKDSLAYKSLLAQLTPPSVEPYDE